MAHRALRAEDKIGTMLPCNVIVQEVGPGRSEIVYIWADGVYLQARMEDAAAGMLVVIGATPEGRKELVGFRVGVRESTQSWRELLVELKARGLVRCAGDRRRGRSSRLL